MAYTNRMKSALAAAVVAAAGLAAPAAAQHATSTTISISNGEVEGTSTRTIDGVDYTIEFDGDGVHTALVDGEEADFEVNDDVVLISTGDGVVRVDVPDTSGTTIRAIGIGDRGNIARVFPRGDIDRLGFGDDVVEGRDFVWSFGGQPKTMVGLSQRALDDQLRAHLDIEEGVGTMIFSVVGGLPADEAGLRVGDVLIAVNGREVTGTEVLTNELRKLEPGDELDVTILRKGLPETLTVEVAPFDGQKLYANRFPGAINAPGAPAGLPLLKDLPWADIGENDFDFEAIEDRIRGELAEIRELDPEQRLELDRALAEAREQMQRALVEADRARELRWRLRGDNELLIRPGQDANERAILIEREDRNERTRDLEAAAGDLRDRNRELMQQNRELQERLEALEVRLDRMLDLLEERGEE